MQSPFMGATNPTSPYGTMAQMFLTSPPENSASTSLPDSHSQFDRPAFQRKYSSSNGLPGVLTPGELTPPPLSPAHTGRQNIY